MVGAREERHWHGVLVSSVNLEGDAAPFVKIVHDDGALNGAASVDAKEMDQRSIELRRIEHRTRAQRKHEHRAVRIELHDIHRSEQRILAPLGPPGVQPRWILGGPNDMALLVDEDHLTIAGIAEPERVAHPPDAADPADLTVAITDPNAPVQRFPANVKGVKLSESVLGLDDHAAVRSDAVRPDGSTAGALDLLRVDHEIRREVEPRHCILR